MPLSYHPVAGEILICHFGDNVLLPEMRKSRPVIVVSPRLRNRGRLATVVPLSTTAPKSVECYHCIIELEKPLPAPFDATSMWAKCDMAAAVSLDRLDRFKEPRSRYGGPRSWRTGQVDEEQLAEIRSAIAAGLGIALTNPAR